MSEDQSHLFSPYRMRDVTARNRLWIAPMCMYSVFAEDGDPPTGIWSTWAAGPWAAPG